jgi:hypothetical protein
VLAGQSGDGPQWEGLQYLAAVHGPSSALIHATANAPYLNAFSIQIAHFRLIFARELCQIALSPLGRDFAAI